MSFAPLHNHSHYSLLDGLTKIEDMVAKAKEFGMPAIGLTDHGSMYGAIDFYMACKKAEIKPIIGVEGYMASRSRFQKESGPDSKRYHLTLLSKNLTGYKNLMKMVTKANLEGYYYKPRMDRELLAEHHEGVICLSGCMGGELARAIANKDLGRAEQVIKDHIDIFGRENYFI
ncbi:MAG TPA: PHP domain-containing protein, partial [Candidatus Paceibacterota bacterium]|nr:PHP domain-containing protein [Candidatus Paceibacterota bacterium]